MDNGEKVICPLCSDAVDKLLYRFHIDSERSVLEKIKMQNPSWTLNDGLCGRCVDYYHTAIVMEQRILPEIGPHFPIKSADDFVILPTPLRVHAHPRYTGKGVTICFIDSGFCAHPDLVATRNRIKLMLDITTGELIDSTTIDASSAWHGTMTTVVCAGNGYLSNGLYKGIACDAELVLLKVQDVNGKITTENLVKALQWVHDHHKAYNIRIVNISLGDDETGSYKESKVDLLAEALIEKGITIIAAVGNDENGKIHPPANSLHVIAIGGIDDGNELNNNIKAYHSNYGATADAFMKPELVAHAIWIAAPILPGTKEHTEATSLYCSISEYKDIEVIARIQQAKYISANYMHVDGTSFATPIVTAVAAQLLEANPSLTPKSIRQILFSTAKRYESILPERQGYGIIQPRKAILKVVKKAQVMRPQTSPLIDRKKNSIEFYIQHDCAEQISLAGSFNNWAPDVLLLEPSQNGIWKIEIPLLAEGRYAYKFLINEELWMEDVENPYREPDGFNGFNSLLFIQN
ncbi:S8 family serine peptidase [Panacibacter ginsenosidivorans]|uniref:S8 family serine peptidase n=1 Tax=Panacibacter ginsenosidivorans TaxID=1813871 RepID=A0A5B8VBP7_9BACT|nr:S8 family serine peptidase [Panacibacter ginsenosidivorans]QEC68947.1 S8 family serine peptidase [Panacibacter ginsenosidivorans]